METKIHSMHFQANDQLKEFIHNKVHKLEHFNHKITACEVSLKLEKSDVDTNKLCEIKLFLPEVELFAKSQCPTFEQACNEAVDAIQGQLRKHKTKEIKRTHH